MFLELELLFLFFNSFSLTYLPVIILVDNFTGLISFRGSQCNLTPFDVKGDDMFLFVFMDAKLQKNILDRMY